MGESERDTSPVLSLPYQSFISLVSDIRLTATCEDTHLLLILHKAHMQRDSHYVRVNEDVKEGSDDEMEMDGKMSRIQCYLIY